MMTWKSLLHEDPTEWLLEDTNPSVKYFTLRWLYNKTENDQDVISTIQAIAESDSIKKLLRRQKPEGYWGTDTRPHHGTQGNLLLLMWLGFKGNEGVKKALDYRINGCLQADGSYGIELKGRLVKLPCHGAILLRQMIWFGYQQDDRIKKLMDWLVEIQNDDGSWPCVSKLRPFSCAWATADVLRAYQDVPKKWFNPEILESQRLAVEMFLNSNLYEYGISKTSQRWFDFGWPLMWDTDILEVMELIAPFVDPNEERIQSSLNLILGKQDRYGRWPCEKHAKGGGWMKKFIEFEEIGNPSKWVTLHALKTLKTLYEKE